MRDTKIRRWVCGIHAVSTLLKTGHREQMELYFKEGILEGRLKQLWDEAQSGSFCVKRLSKVYLDEQFPHLQHQGVVAATSQSIEYTEKDLMSLLTDCAKPYLILVLDGITDPHNLGACLRSADAAGVNFVIVPKDNNAKLTPTVSKVASGAAETVPIIRVTNLVRVMDSLRHHGIWIFGAAGEAHHSLYEQDFKGSIALVMGAEGHGLRRLTRDHCDGLFHVPMLGHVSSLNVSVAAGVILYEAVRQRC